MFAETAQDCGVEVRRPFGFCCLWTLNLKGDHSMNHHPTYMFAPITWKISTAAHLALSLAGLKPQHVTSLQWLATVTGATVSGLSVGSHTVEFHPSLTPPAAATALLQQQQQQQQPKGTKKSEGGSSSSNEKPLQIRIAGGSPAASALLIFQAILPFLLFAGATTTTTTTTSGDGDGKAPARPPPPIDLEIRGGTNVSFSPSYEYIDQVLLPALAAHWEICSGPNRSSSSSSSSRTERARPLAIERQLLERGWSVGAPLGAGLLRFRIRPLGAGEMLRLRRRPRTATQDGGGGDDEKEDEHKTREDPARHLARIDATILAPAGLHAPLQTVLARDLDALFPEVGVRFVTAEESGHDARMYVLLVAHAEEEGEETTEGVPAAASRRWGRDYLYDRGGRRNKTPEVLSNEISRTVTRGLFEEVAVTRGAVDEFLQDQLVVFQALAEGMSSFPRGGDVAEELQDQEHVVMAGDKDVKGVATDIGRLQIGKDRRMRRDRTDEPFGRGSKHTTTARWVAAELLPQVKWYNKGSICEGAGVSFS
jgi:RNA 3'-terminal phosphate cyclase (ATP)